LRLDELELGELVVRAQHANELYRRGAGPVSGSERLASATPPTREEISRAVATAESRVIRRAIEAAQRAQQQRLFASLGRR
jgi:hypothetical protein